MKINTESIRDVLLIVFGAALIGFGFNLFLISHQLLSGGLSGVSMLVGYMTQWNIGWLYFMLNVPLFIWGWFAIGKRYIYLSGVSVAATVLFMQITPEMRINGDPIIAGVFGGILVGIGTGLSFRAGGSTGGFDIVGSIVTRRHDFPLCIFLFCLNGVVVLMLGLLLKNWDLALYSMMSMFVTGKAIDIIHIRQIKITAFIITSRKKELLEKLLRFQRGVTVIRTQGAFTEKEYDMLMTVTTRFELQELKKTIMHTDPKAFVNIVETAGVMGLFRRD